MNFDAFVGLPWRDKGRERDGLDCYGLVALVYAEQAGIVLPSYAEDYATSEDREAVCDLIEGRAEPWREVAERDVRPLDLVLLRHAGVERHIGLVVRRGYVLHIGLDLNVSRIESYRAGRLARRVSRFMRHEELS